MHADRMTPEPGSAAERYAVLQRRIGTITPSANTVVERVTLGVIQDLPEVSMHFARTPVSGATDSAPTRYDMAGLLEAARLLAHVEPEVLLWNGSKGAGIGFAHDRALAQTIFERTQIRTTTSILALAAALAARGLRRLGIVTPYTSTLQRQTLDCLTREGYPCVAEACAGVSDNLSFADVPLDLIASMARAVRTAEPDAIVFLCTNFPGAVLAAPLEQELGTPVFDSTALGVWHALQMAGIDTTRAAPRWGSLFLQRI